MSTGGYRSRWSQSESNLYRVKLQRKTSGTGALKVEVQQEPQPARLAEFAVSPLLSSQNNWESWDLHMQNQCIRV